MYTDSLLLDRHLSSLSQHSQAMKSELKQINGLRTQA
jgi:hypothetical protein